MKFLCDVHISFKLVNTLIKLGYETVHVNNILEKWYSKDADIVNYADLNDYIIITKDADFRNSFFLNQKPKKLLKINLGNMPNIRLVELTVANIEFIEKINQKHQNFIVELDADNCSYFVG